MRPKLTVGMACFDDHQGVWFTIQALRWMHQEILDSLQIVVVDNNPNSQQGKQTKNFVDGWLTEMPHPGKYIAAGNVVGTSAPRNLVFQHGDGETILCMDAHVLIQPGGLSRLIQYVEQNPDNQDLYHGPMTHDSLKSYITHFDPVWRSEMWGIWSVAWDCHCGAKFVVHDGEGIALCFPLATGMEMGQPVRACPVCGRSFPQVPYAGHEKHLWELGYVRSAERPNAEPFAIPGMGMGLFASRKDSWLKFNEHARGFGAEEMCIHEKYRQAGRTSLCLPWLRWVHFFGRIGTPYPLNVWNKVRNYVCWFKELGLDYEPIHRHFVQELGKMPKHEWDILIADPEKTLWPNAQPAKPCMTCGGRVAESATLEDLYHRAKTTVSDINEHVDQLRGLASQCDTVVEFGMRHGVSTVAILAGQPKRFVTYDLKSDPIADGLKRLQGKTDFEFRQGDSLLVDPMDCDMLFIDTKHTGEHVYQELTRHGDYVKRFIVLHDTYVFGERGEDGTPGLLVGLRSWLRSNPEWIVIYHTQANNGLTVLSKDPEAKKKLPSLAKMAWNYAKALARHVATGQEHASEAVVRARLDQCLLCDQRTEGNRCASCGCFLDQAPDGREGKALWKESECPLGKWLHLEGIEDPLDPEEGKEVQE